MHVYMAPHAHKGECQFCYSTLQHSVQPPSIVSSPGPLTCQPPPAAAAAPALLQG
jgi:hypothetical protein